MYFWAIFMHELLSISEIPKEIGQLESLENFDLSTNQITGTI